jgi:hypothetical protein
MCRSLQPKRFTSAGFLRTVALSLVLGSGLLAQAPAPTLRGTWSASVGAAQAVGGTWSASLPEANVAKGAFTVLNERNQVVLQGTWAATKSAQGWRGSWSARLAGGRRPGQTFTGTWQAEGALAGRTLSDLLQGTLAQEVTGAWQARGRAGKWRLMGSRP